MRPTSSFRLLPWLAPLLLAGCINDGATYQIDNTGQHNLSLVREQTFFWDKKINFYLVVARMPTCMRRHAIGSLAPKTPVEVWQVPSGAYIIRAARFMYATETQTCEGFAKMDAEPAEGLGELVGTFVTKNGGPVFEPAKKAPPAASTAAQ